MHCSAFLDLAKNCKEFFDPNDIPEMLGEVLPLLSPDVCRFPAPSC